MAEAIRLIGLESGEVDLDRQEVGFTLTNTLSQNFEFVAAAGVAEQITSALSRMCTALREAAIAGNVTRPIAAEPVAEAIVQRDRLHDLVLLQLITPSGTAYSFSLDLQAAIDISDRLKTESAKGVPSGTA